MKKKVWDITVKDNPNRVVMGENDDFYTTDTEAYLVFNLDDNNFNPPSAVLTLENRNDGSLKNETVDVVDGLIEWEMPQRYIEHFGNWQGQLVYYDPKEDVPEDTPEEDKFETYTSAPFTFVVNAHIGDKKKPSLVEIENWEKFIREGTKLIETWEDMEDLRQANEAQRQENYQELLDTGVLQTNINTKLEQLEEEYAPKLTEVTTQLAQIESKTLGYGTRADRPSTPETADLFFLTDKKKRIEFNGITWQYLDGSPVDVLEISDGNIYQTSARYTNQTLANGAESTYQTDIDMANDLIWYAKVKLNSASDFFNVNFGIGSSLQFKVGFGYDWAGAVTDGQSISINDFINTANNTKLGSANLYSTARNIIVWYDRKWGYVNVYIDNVLIGSWKPVSGANINGVTQVFAKVGNSSSVIFDYLYMAKPLVVTIGDSITGGATKHAPNPDHYAGIDDYSNNYPKMISDYLSSKGIKNYFVVNKGVNGETTEQIKNRFTTDVISTGCKYVFIHGGINDHGVHGDTNISTANKLIMYDSALANNIEPMLLGVIPTRTDAPLESHQFAISLRSAEQNAYTNRLYVDLWDAIEGSVNVADTSKMADSVHPNLSGYTSIASKIIEYVE